MATACLGTLILGFPNDLRAQEPFNSGQTTLDTSRVSLGIDPNEKDFLKIRESVRETMTRALPENYSIKKVLVSNHIFDREARDFLRDAGIHSNLYARLEIDKNGKPFTYMHIYVLGNEQQAKKLTDMGNYPYIQREGNMVIEFFQDRNEGHDFQVELGRRLGISPDATRVRVYDGPLGLDPNESDLTELGKSVMEAVDKVLPQGVSVARNEFWNDPSNPDLQQLAKEMGGPVRMYGHLIFREGEQKRLGMQILVADNEALAEKMCEKYVYPYAQRAGNIVVIFPQKDDLSNYDSVVEIAKKLGLSRQLK